MTKKDETKLQNYRVLTACIIAALHPNEPAKAGVVYTPEDEADRLEAESLAHVGYVKKTDDAANAETWAKRRTAADAQPVVTLEDTGTVANTVPPLQQAGQINVSPDGGQSTESTTGTEPTTGTPVAVTPLSDDKVAEFLGNKAEDVIATLQGAGTYAHAQQLLTAEAAGKNRKTVLEALTAALPSKE